MPVRKATAAEVIGSKPLVLSAQAFHQALDGRREGGDGKNSPSESATPLESREP